MKKIKLARGEYTLVDNDDYENLMAFRWYVSCFGYVVRAVGKRKVIMHRVVANTPKGMMTDHINRNKLDNRKENLRICTNSENQYNRLGNKGSASKYKGVAFSKKLGKWQAQIWFGGRQRHLGMFEDQKEAAKRYNEEAVNLGIKTILLNVIE